MEFIGAVVHVKHTKATFYKWQHTDHQGTAAGSILDVLTWTWKWWKDKGVSKGAW